MARTLARAIVMARAAKTAELAGRKRIKAPGKFRRFTFRSDWAGVAYRYDTLTHRMEFQRADKRPTFRQKLAL